MTDVVRVTHKVMTDNLSTRGNGYFVLGLGLGKVFFSITFLLTINTTHCTGSRFQNSTEISSVNMSGYIFNFIT